MPHQPCWVPLVYFTCLFLACIITGLIVTFLPSHTEQTSRKILTRALAAIDVPNWLRSGAHSLAEGTVLRKRGDTSPTRNELLWNSVGFGIVAYISFLLRMLNRGWVLRKIQIEDYGMCIVIILFTNLLVWINVSARFDTNLYSPEQEAAILADPQEVADRVFGSKIVIALEQSMLLTTWGCKLCIWAFLFRVHRKTRYEITLHFLLLYIFVGLLVIEVLYFFLFCTPFAQYWAVPVENSECATYHIYSIVQMSFNVSSDILLVMSPMPLVWKTKLPLKRKLILTAVFSLASLTIACAIMNKFYNFASPDTTIYQIWYLREASVSVTVANLICIWQLLQHCFQFRSFDDTRFDIRDDNGAAQVRRARAWTWRRPTDVRQSKTDGSRNSTVHTADTELEAQAQVLKGRPLGRDERRNTQFTLTGDDGDAGPAILYRSYYNIS
ncbi:hypothetical protein LZ554_004143 [Drepanopeziza brunnea f. sp. 'monogermtubi']|nr:hypothetical protein LZ554_004143 [Drepanopeziza brunnea f. sp. 'monogermtubi']